MDGNGSLHDFRRCFLHLFSLSTFYYEVFRELYNVLALRIHYLDRRWRISRKNYGRSGVCRFLVFAIFAEASLARQ